MHLDNSLGPCFSTQPFPNGKNISNKIRKYKKKKKENTRKKTLRVFLHHHTQINKKKKKKKKKKQKYIISTEFLMSKKLYFSIKLPWIKSLIQNN